MTADGLAIGAGRIRAEVERWLTFPEGSDGLGSQRPGIDPEREVDAWLSLDEASRARLEERLRVLSRLRREGRRGDAARVATELEMSRPNVVRLMKRMDEVGPVTGLITQKRIQVPRSVIRDGFPEPVEEWLQAELAAHPAISASDLEAHLRERCRVAAKSVDLPSASALRRRIEHLRKLGFAVAESGPLLGRSLLVDAGWVDLWVQGGSPTGSEPGQVRVMFMIDVGTRLICGAHAHLEPHARELSGLLGDVRRRFPDFATMQMPVAEAVETVRWVVPSEFSSRSSFVGAYVPAERRPRYQLSKRNVRRLETDLLSEIGDRLGGLRLSPRPAAADASSRILPAIGEAVYLLSREVENHNGSIVRTLLDQGATSTVGSRGRTANTARADALVRDMVAMFVSVSIDDEVLEPAVRRAYS